MRLSTLALALLTSVGCSQPGDMPSDANNNHPGSDAPHGGSADAPPVSSTSSVSIIVEPNSNHASELVTAINGAQHSVYMTMYQIDHTQVLAALVAKKQAGVDVQAILDGSTTCKSWNMPAYTQLQNAGISVVWSNPSFTYTHEKTVIIDGQTAWIMTMNLNTSPPSSNREYLAIDTDAADVAEATAIFHADHAMQSISPSGSLVVANANARPDLVALINTAATSLDVEGEELSDLDLHGVVNAISAAAARGVTVHVVVANDSAPPSNQTTSIANIKMAGGHVVVTGPTSANGTSSNPYIHSKAIVVDGAKAFVGSENFTGGSLGYNRELGVIFNNASEVAKVASAISTDFSHGTPQ
jgi:phosphatidylserine/phosphatidylglycerophosphate/cardiolipin synthase-like enzyme